MKLIIKIGPAQVRLDNLFNGDPLLGRATNEVINENVDIFLNEIIPNLEDALATKFTDIANKITKRFTYKELFPDN